MISQPVRASLLALGALGVLAGGAYLIWLTITGLGPTPCNQNDTFSGWHMIGFGGGAFVLGQALAWPRRRHDISSLDHEPTLIFVRWRRAHPRGTALISRSVLAAFLLFVAFILVYEAVSLWNPPGDPSSANPWGLQPITHYVRCAKSDSPYRTAAVATVVSFFIGHWIRPPLRQDSRARSGSSADSHRGGP